MSFETLQEMSQTLETDSGEPVVVRDDQKLVDVFEKGYEYVEFLIDARE